MSEKPILFSGAMVRAILDGRKTQTRRIVKHIPALGYPEDWCERAAGIVDMVGDYRRFCPYGRPGDRLWVRESFQPFYADGIESRYDTDYKTGKGYAVSYPSTDGVIEYLDESTDSICSRVKPSIHMPRWASRISLEVKAVRVERLQDISEADAEAEGVDPRGDGSARYRAAFRLLWCEIYGHASWDANPWLWCVSFARVRP